MLAQAMLVLGLSAAALALLVSVVQWVRGRLDLTPFLDILLLVALIVLNVFGSVAASGVGMMIFFGIWIFLFRKRVRHWELERAVGRSRPSAGAAASPRGEPDRRASVILPVTASRMNRHAPELDWRAGS